ncbi:MAG TPA: hypothetical protein VIX81_03735 [Gammaproteobacteria bacterium]
MRQRTRERLGETILDWAHRGLLDDTTAQRLAAGYLEQGRESGGRRALVRWLATLAILLLLSSGMGVVALLLEDLPTWLIALLLAGVAGGLGVRGGQMATDPEQRRPYTGQVLLTTGIGLAHGALVLLYVAAGGDAGDRETLWLLLLVALLALAAAYHFRLRWPLLLGLAYLFHGLGSGHGYAGHGGYFLDIVDTQTMALVATLAAAFGVFHESRLESGPLRRHLGFGHVYVVFGLLYLNLSTWILSLFPGDLEWVLLFTATGIAQLVAGAALKDARFTGFGIVFLSIDLYTRLFERFWDRLDAGTALLLAGLLALALGVAFEWRARRLAEAGR